MNPCSCIETEHSHEGTCGKDGFSNSIEHGNEWYCRECYQHFVNAKDNVKAFQAALMEVAIKQPEKLKEARALVAKTLGASN